jgi:hypothetical protein
MTPPTGSVDLPEDEDNLYLDIPAPIGSPPSLSEDDDIHVPTRILLQPRVSQSYSLFEVFLKQVGIIQIDNNNNLHHLPTDTPPDPPVSQVHLLVKMFLK